MAASSSSFNDQSDIVIMLDVKPNQNMIIDLDSSRYNAILQPMMECLKYSRISQALTMSESVPVVHLSSAYSSAIYNKAEETISFEVASHKTSISKSRFSRLLGFTSHDNLVDPDSISCNGLFTLLFKGLSERVAGSDSTSRLFYTIIYGLYHSINLDFGFVLLNQLVQSLTSSTHHMEISCTRLWSIIVHRALTHFKVHLMKDSVMAAIPLLSTTTFVMTDPKNFDFVGSIPKEMLERPRKKPKKTRSLTLVIEEKEESKERTRSEIPKDDTIYNEEEDTASKIPPSETHGQDPHSSKPSNPTSPKPSPKPSNPTSTPPSSDEDDILFKDEHEELTTFVHTLLFVDQNSEAMVEALTKANSKVLENSAKAIGNLEKLMTETTIKVEKLLQEVVTFIKDFRTSNDANTKSVNKVITGFWDSLKAEKEALSVLRADIKKENADLASSLNAKVEKLQQDLAMENQVMVQLAEKNQKVKVLYVKLKHASEQLDTVTNENAVIKSCVSDISSYLQRVVETNDSLLTPSIRNHLTDKLHPKIFDDDDEEDKEELTEAKKLVREKKDKELDDLNELHKKLDAEEAEARDAQISLEARKLLFPLWSVKRIQKEALDEPKVYWLELAISFYLSNDVESQLDFPITPRAFLFRCFETIEKALISDPGVNHKLFSFYLKYAKPQYESWSLKNIIRLRV
ncbi:hypothetical protein L2E82_45654 [Cichorium intybus]|uniref:Uncharacterized protein n=1 Tax=Cichorium intybus TaxID=13427 RepID=A0ACB8ZT65_CICIN|nr:hypothetical protein L2E82_45654 [Cichorium intybus]